MINNIEQKIKEMLVGLCDDYPFRGFDGLYTVIELEEIYNIEITEEEVDEIKTKEDALKIIVRKIDEKL